VPEQTILREESIQATEPSNEDNVNQMQGSEHEHDLPLTFLIGSGSSDNFLQPRLAHC